jgi:dTDP-4-amino-4,6-dideoxygalactose transaminase
MIMNNIQMTDLKIQYEGIKDQINAAMQEVINESGFILGRQVNLLEKDIADYFGVRYGAGVASGTDALVLALAALGVNKGDEVITTPFTFIATAEAISRVGATPVFCDIDEDTYNLDVKKLSAKITERTKAIIPVHLYGLACEMDAIMAVAKEHKLKVVEDCAQSFGSEYDAKKVGCFGDCGCLSFFPAKTLGCLGDGGMILTDDEKILDKLKMLRNHGSSNKYLYSIHGYNSRLDTLQAAVLRVKLRYVDSWIEKRINNAAYYSGKLSDIASLRVPAVPARTSHTFNYYTVRIKDKRDAVQAELKQRGIPTAVYYPLCLHLQELYKGLGYHAGDFPVAENAQNEVLSLPMYPELAREQMDLVIAALKESL